jgi:hypothetical protein
MLSSHQQFLVAGVVNRAPRQLGVPNERILLVGVREQAMADEAKILAPRGQALVAGVEIPAPK